MNRKLFTITLMALLALFLIVGRATGQGPEPEGEVSSATTVNSRISYQGMLAEDGSPVTGDRDMTFRLYSDEACSTMIWPPIIRSNVPLTDGLFSVVLDVTPSDFNGQGLWLEVEVEGTVVVDCQEILPAPYALSLRPGAEISDENSKVQLNHYSITGVQSGIQAEVSGSPIVARAVYGLASATDGTTYGVFGQSNSSDGTGVYGTAPDTGVQGYASAFSATSYGVYGESNSSDGAGVYGTAPDKGVQGHATSYGVYGESDSSDGTGVYGTAPYKGVQGHATSGLSATSYGVYGESDSFNGAGVYGTAPGEGVRGHATSSGTGVYGTASFKGVQGYASATGGSSYGVYGESVSTDQGKGVYGQAPKYGVYGYASAATGTTYGVYGWSNSPDGAGVYAQGAYEGADLILGADSHFASDGRIYSDPAYISSDIWLVANDAVRIKLNNSGASTSANFDIVDKDENLIFNVDESGMTQVKILQITGGSDLAEPFEIAGAESIVPGLVVAIDPEHPGQLRIADKAYDRTVAGCVSGANGVNPGLTMEQEGTVAEGSLPVALSGRVYCWADASYGPIQPGGLLTTSDTPGHVMQVTDYAQAQGAIIGKAMSSLEEGRGLILVLVSLQ